MQPVRLSLQIGMPRSAGSVHVPGVAGVMQSVTVASPISASLIPLSLIPVLLPALAPDAPLPDLEPPFAPDIVPLPLPPDFEPAAPDVAALVPDSLVPVDSLSVPLIPEVLPELSPLPDMFSPGLDAQPVAVRPARSNPNRKDDALEITPLI